MTPTEPVRYSTRGCKDYAHHVVDEGSVSLCAEHVTEVTGNAQGMCAQENCPTMPVPGIHSLDSTPHAKDLSTTDLSSRCMLQGCRRPPTHGREGSLLAKYCGLHAPDTMVDVMHEQNDTPSWLEYPTTGPSVTAPPSSRPLEINMSKANGCTRLDVPTRPEKIIHEGIGESAKSVSFLQIRGQSMRESPPRCTAPGCVKPRTSDEEGSTHSIYCSDHVGCDVIKVRCRTTDEFNRPASHGTELTMKTVHHAEHAPRGCVPGQRGTNMRCSRSGCLEYIVPGTDGSIEYPPVCSRHSTASKTVARVDLCAEKDCHEQPTFGLEGTTTAVYCSEHALQGMVDVETNQDEDHTCDEDPSLETGVVSSAKHLGNDSREDIKADAWQCTTVNGVAEDQTLEMDGTSDTAPHTQPAAEDTTDVNHRRCAYGVCRVFATFCEEGSTSPMFCGRHASEGMVRANYRSCIFEDCVRKASFACKGRRRAAWCSDHAEPGMIEVASRSCVREGCLRKPFFGWVNDGFVIACVAHVEDGMVDLSKKRCFVDGCSKVPSYGILGETACVACAAHAAEGMVSLKRKVCKVPRCSKYPSFGVKGTGPSRCAEHATTDMVNLRRRRCEAPNCEKSPSFASLGGRRPVFCSQHAHEGMVNVKNRMCGEGGCRTQPSYGMEGTKRTIYCSKHAKPGMVNLINTLCAKEDCRRYPTHGVEESKCPVYCAQHAAAGMINVKRRRCLYEGCDQFASFGGQGGRRASYCADHAPEGSVSLKGKCCAEVNCSGKPTHGVEGSRCAVYCHKHARKDMVEGKNKRCREVSCRRHPRYGVMGTRCAVYCSEHAETGMVNVTVKDRCAHDGCSAQVSSNVDRDTDGNPTFCVEHIPKGDSNGENVGLNGKKSNEDHEDDLRTSAESGIGVMS